MEEDGVFRLFYVSSRELRHEVSITRFIHVGV